MATIQLGNTKVANKLIDYCEKKAVERSGVDCLPDYSKEQFKITRELWGKNTGVQAHHIIQSFKPGEITPSKANEVGKSLAEQIAKGHEVSIYTHSDKAHIHNHIVINSVNYENGSKYQSSKKDLYKIREISDQLCEEKNLSVVKEPSANVRYTLSEKNILEKGQTSWKDEIREVIDVEKKSSKDYEEFKKNLFETYKIEVKERGKYISFKHPEFKRFVRGKTLGLDYERSTIEDGFSRQIERTTSKERGYTDLSDIRTTEKTESSGEGNREFDEGNNQTQSTDEIIYKRTNGQGSDYESNNHERNTSNGTNININSGQDDEFIERARQLVEQQARVNATNVSRVLRPDARTRAESDRSARRTREETDRKARELEQPNSKKHDRGTKHSKTKHRGFER